MKRLPSALLFSLSLAACDPHGEEANRGPANRGPAPTARSPHGDIAEAVVTPAAADPLAQLLGSMEGHGEGAQARYEANLLSLLASPHAATTLINFYEKLPLDARPARWKVVYAATQIASGAALPFLERVALAPSRLDPRPPVTMSSQHDHDQGGSSDDKIKRAAAVGVAQRALAGTPGAAASLDKILKEGDREIAVAAAIELFSAGKLTAAHEGILAGRGFPHRFQRVSQEEQLRRMRISPDDLQSKPPERRKNGSTPPSRPNAAPTR